MSNYILFNFPEKVVLKQALDSSGQIFYKKVNPFVTDTISGFFSTIKNNVIAITQIEDVYEKCKDISLQQSLFIIDNDDFKIDEDNTLNLVIAKNTIGIKQILFKNIFLWYKEKNIGIVTIDDEEVLKNVFNDFLLNSNLSLKSEFSFKGIALNLNFIPNFLTTNVSCKELGVAIYSKLRCFDLNSPKVFLSEFNPILKLIFLNTLKTFSLSENKNYNKVDFFTELEDILKFYDFDSSSLKEQARIAELEIQIELADKQFNSFRIEDSVKTLESIKYIPENYKVKVASRLKQYSNKLLSLDNVDKYHESIKKVKFEVEEKKFDEAKKKLYKLKLLVENDNIKTKQIEELLVLVNNEESHCNNQIENENIIKLKNTAIQALDNGDKPKAIELLDKAKNLAVKINNKDQIRQIDSLFKSIDISSKSNTLKILFFLVLLVFGGFFGLKSYGFFDKTIEINKDMFVNANIEGMIRSGPSKNFGEVSRLARGSKVYAFYQDKKTNWYYVEIDKKGTKGYISHTLLSESIPSDIKIINKTGYLTIDANLRSGPNSTTKTIDVIKKRQEVFVEFHDEKNNFYKINYLDSKYSQKLEGHVYSKLIKFQQDNAIEITDDQVPKTSQQNADLIEESQKIITCDQCNGLKKIKKTCAKYITTRKFVLNPLKKIDGKDLCKRCQGKQPLINGCTMCGGDGTYSASWKKGTTKETREKHSLCKGIGWHYINCVKCYGSGIIKQ